MRNERPLILRPERGTGPTNRDEAVLRGKKGGGGGGRGEKHLAFEGKWEFAWAHGADGRVGDRGLARGRGGGAHKGAHSRLACTLTLEFNLPLLHLGSPFMGLPFRVCQMLQCL